MDYQSYESGADLKLLIKCYWTLTDEAHENPERQRIVPDGCMEMIFQLGDPYQQHFRDGTSIKQPNYFVFGQITEGLEISPLGRTEIFSVRFYPETFSAFSSMKVADMENRAVPLIEIFGIDGKLLAENIKSAESTVHRIEICERFLLSRLSGEENIDKVIKSSLDLMLSLQGQLSIRELTDRLNINRKQLERKFSSVIGLSPKQLARIIRLQATMKLLANNRFSSLSEIAIESDYYDQAHFIRDFREFTGVSPKQFFAESLKMSSLFLNED